MNRRMIAALVFVLPLSGCMQPRPAAPPVARVFVYTPPEQTQKSQNVTIALVRPVYAEATKARLRIVSPVSIEAFASSLRSDMEKILIAKGFKVTGPYESLDMMTFPEKKGANLTLTPTIELVPEARVTRRTAASSILIGTEEGTLTVGGWVSLVMLEPMSGEKMWIKRVDVEAVQMPYSRTYTMTTTSAGQRVEHPRTDSRGDALTSALNLIYPKVMDRTWTYFHPDEIALTKIQADEVRERKRY